MHNTPKVVGGSLGLYEMGAELFFSQALEQIASRSQSRVAERAEAGEHLPDGILHGLVNENGADADAWNQRVGSDRCGCDQGVFVYVVLGRAWVHILIHRFPLCCQDIGECALHRVGGYLNCNMPHFVLISIRML